MEIIDKSNIIWPHNATKLQNPHHANLLDVGHRFSDSQFGGLKARENPTKY